MANLVLVVGSKRWSSWSLRPWLALKQSGLAFDEVLIELRQPDSKANILAHSPSGWVPVLKNGTLTVWDSLAICEYVAELACAVPLWPENKGARAIARSVSAEMHSGFPALRNHLSMDLTQRIALSSIPDDAKVDIARIQALWNDCRSRFGAGGPFLFGRWSIADAMYAPVVTRFDTYSVPLDPVSAAYSAAVLAMPAMQEWIAAAKLEAVPA
ncbi:glutathione S-transferase family protein [Telmatospirillum sp.]|uniref:glutathione S-transferase family protein n=1 Tax=Telmatospirillum sp. TaxID=2079197 RepID=UPI0028459F8D|nr:glutathione S-transferase family protein [Telmatospirillum sp.]MDR3438558.1 glutathione S-transferase family protein [Telmatospirillum sp.]